MSKYNYIRRKTIKVPVGNVYIGGDTPVLIQSMTDTDTCDTESSVRQIQTISRAGAGLVRLTTQGERQARNLENISRQLTKEGCHTAISADVHFNPAAAMTAALYADKVRINPGNFIDAARTFIHLDFSEQEYEAELKKITDAMRPLIERCRQYGRALRIGVNHGSLSDRIMSRYGDTPEGMKESVMEFLRVCRDENFNRVVVSIKSSSPAVMTETVKLTATAMDAEGMNFPLHLGVTEAGEGNDGRIKSAAGIGALLAEGYGDTIRVSLSEPPENEIPVARELADYISGRQNHHTIPEPQKILAGKEREHTVPVFPEADTSKAFVASFDFPIPEKIRTINAASKEIPNDDTPFIITSDHINAPGEIAAYLDRLRAVGNKAPAIIMLRDKGENGRLHLAADYGFLLLNGYGSAILPEISGKYDIELARDILQACGMLRFKTEYISCPGCGRTLFDLHSTLAEVKKATSHLSHLKIGVMGCIVNGPGEMADADYGYVGAGPGRVSLYKGKQLIVKNIPSEEALPKLICLIKENGDWTDPD